MPYVSLVKRNLRDLGGLPTREPGVFVKPGHFFRSSALSAFDLDEHRALVALDLGRAIDLRTHGELAVPRAVAIPTHLRVIHLPLFESARPNWIAPADQSPRATAGRYLEMLQDGLGTIAAIVAELARPAAPPFLISCSAGRDRTGIVVACLLDLLDVTDEAIAADYAQSDSFDPSSGRAHASTMLELFALVRHGYGSTQHLLASRGVTEATVQALRGELLVRRAH